MFVCLTEHDDVDAGGAALAVDALGDLADVVSAVGHRDTREEEAGVHDGHAVRHRFDLRRKENKEVKPFSIKKDITELHVGQDLHDKAQLWCFKLTSSYVAE